MKVQKLSLVFFKNHTDLHLEMDEVVAIAGLNGVGKTSVLDALHFLCLGKSYFSSTDIQCIQTDKIQSGIIAQIITHENIDLKVKLKRGSKKTIQRNGVVRKKLADHVGEFIAVIIAPNDIELIYGTHEKRRSFINQVISQVNKKHLQELLTYTKLIEHRNKHLKEDTIDRALIQTIDEQISPIAHSIHQVRLEFFNEFSTYFQTRYHEISGQKEEIKLSYISQLDDDSYLNLTPQYYTKDVTLRRSSCGIHKDEIEIELNHLNLRKYGSQGQIKSGLIALKLAEYSFLSDKINTKPLLLLDDIFEKIDEERAKVLTQIIKNDNFGQIFITDTDSSRLESFCEEIGKPFKTITLH